MKARDGFSLVLFLLLPTLLPAKISRIGLLYPVSESDGPVLLFPVKEGYTPESAIDEYITELATIGPRCWGNLPRATQPQTLFMHRNFVPFSARDGAGNATSDEGVRMLVLANRIGHMCPSDPFPYVRQKLTAWGAVAHVLPIRLDLVLGDEELKELEGFLIENYHGLVAIGGADIHPEVYGEEQNDGYHPLQGVCRRRGNPIRSGDSSAGDRGDVDIGPLRYFREIDEFERDLLQTWMKVDQGTVFGICRGHQLLSVILGGDLTSDIASMHPQKVRHRAPAVDECEDQDQATSGKSSWHVMKLLDKSNILYKTLGKTEILVNSRHHQAIMFPETQDIKSARVVGVTDDVIEAMELDGGRGFTVQFHPEDMQTEDGDRVIKAMVDTTRARARARSPSRFPPPSTCTCTCPANTCPFDGNGTAEQQQPASSGAGDRERKTAELWRALRDFVWLATVAALLLMANMFARILWPPVSMAFGGGGGGQCGVVSSEPPQAHVVAACG